MTCHKIKATLSKYRLGIQQIASTKEVLPDLLLKLWVVKVESFENIFQSLSTQTCLIFYATQLSWVCKINDIFYILSKCVNYEYDVSSFFMWFQRYFLDTSYKIFKRILIFLNCLSLCRYIFCLFRTTLV